MQKVTGPDQKLLVSDRMTGIKLCSVARDMRHATRDIAYHLLRDKK